MRISIIIPTLNRSKLLELAIESFCSQNISPTHYEILIVDNDSTDDTKNIAGSVIALFPSHNIRYIYEPEPGLLSGRHRGALEAKGDILTFVDDDIEADVNWLKAIKESFDDPTVQIVGGRSLPKYEIELPEWLTYFWVDHPYGRFCAELSLLDFGDEVQVIDANYVWGLNFSIRKKALFELGGFHPDCIPRPLQYLQGDGETGLTQKANQQEYKAIYQPKALVLHSVSKERMTYEYFEKRHFYQGVCDSYSLIRDNDKYPLSNHFQKKIKPTLRKLKLASIKFAGKIGFFTQKDILKYRFYSAYIQGYEFHQNAIRENPQLLEWVLKPNYWNYKLPI